MMGYYIETPGYTVDKAAIIANKHGGVVVSRQDARKLMDDGKSGIIIVVKSGLFEAAAFAFNSREWDDFHRPDDNRPKRYVVLTRELAETLSGYKRAGSEKPDA